MQTLLFGRPHVSKPSVNLMERNHPDPASSALPAPQSMLDPVAFAAGDCEVPAAARLRVGEALADGGRPPAGGMATAGAAADATHGGKPAQAPSSQLCSPALLLLPNLLLQLFLSFAPASS